MALAITCDSEPSRYVSSTASPITCTKEDLGLKEVYIEPCYTQATPDAFVNPDGLTSLTGPKLSGKKDGDEKAEGEKVDPESVSVCYSKKLG